MDIAKYASIRAINLSDPALITCIADEYGYEGLYAKAIEFYGDPGDVLILINSSGKSRDITDGVNLANEGGFILIINSGVSEKSTFEWIVMHIIIWK